MRCMICQKVVEEGALGIWDQFICLDCERLLLDPALNLAHYEQVSQALRSLWQKQFFTKRNHHSLENQELN